MSRVKMDKYYCVTPLSKYPAEPEEKWYAEFRKKYPCLHGQRDAPMDVVVEYPGKDVALNFVQGVGIGLARLDFLEVLGSAGEEHLVYTRLLDASHRPLDNFRALWSNYRLRIRGGPKSTRQFCTVCGRFLYYPMGKRYLLKEYVTGQPIYYSSFGDLVVNERLYRKITHHRFPKIGIYELPVLEKPNDGLPADLNLVKPEDL